MVPILTGAVSGWIVPNVAPERSSPCIAIEHKATQRAKQRRVADMRIKTSLIMKYLLLWSPSQECREAGDALGDCSTWLTKYDGLLRQPVFISAMGLACI